MCRDYARRLFPLIAILAVLGCNGTGGPSVNYVEGVVTLDGKPIDGVTVSFTPAKAGEGTPAVGTTDANGVFKLTATPNGAVGAGAGAGEYLVAFSKMSQGGGNPAVTKSEDPGYGAPSSREPTKVERVVPEKYENPSTSGFKATVKSGTNKGDAFKFDLKKE